MLDIRLLGSPLIYLNGDLLTIKRRATRALLFYLASNQEPIGRDQLCDFLWAENGDQSEQRRKLRGTLNNLKKAFSDVDVDLINTYHDTVYLERKNLRVDLHDFSSALSKMRNYARIRHEGQALPPTLYQDLVNAANLWRGSSFIDNGDLYLSETASEWWARKNHALEQDQCELYKFLSRLEGGVGKTEKAISWAKKALLINEYNEEAHYLFLRSMVRANQREKARQYYRSIEDDFVQEFDGAFSEQIRALGKELFQKTGASPTYARPEWSIHPSVHAPFIGQQDAIQILRKSYLTGKAALILGEAGAGKTRLVQEFYQSLEIPHHLLLLACHPTGGNLPYQPWIDMLRNEISDETWLELPDIWRKPLMMLLPKLGEGRNGLLEDTEHSYAKTIVFDAIKNLLALIASKEACILFVDDAHWADEATLSLLVYLVEQSFFKHQNMRLVVTARVGEINVELEKLLLGALKNRIEFIETLRLNVNDISDLAFHLFEEKLSPEIAARFLRDTGGNPFFVLEVLSAYGVLSEEGKLDFALHIPASLKALIEMRVAKLSPLARKVLLLAAIQGNPFDFDILEKAANLSLESLANLIEELEKAQLIRNTKKKNRLEYAFVHEIIRETLISSPSAVKSRLLHTQIAQAIEEINKKQPDKQAAILAEHYEKAGELSHAFDLWVQTGKYDYSLFSIDDASIAFRRAESLISRASLSDEQIYALYAPWGTTHFANDDPNTLEGIMQTLLSIGKERGSSLLIGAALDGMSDVCMARNEFDKGLSYADEALSYLETGNHLIAQMKAQMHRGVFLYMSSQFTASQEPLQLALELGEKSQDKEALAALGHANYHIAVTWVGMGWPFKALKYAKQSLRELTLSKATEGPVIAHSILALANYYLANYEEGKAHSLQTITLATQKDSWRMMGYGHGYAGMNETELASFGTAWCHAHKAIEIGEKYGHTEIISIGYKVIGDIYTHLDAYPQAAEAYQRGVDVDSGSFAMLENLARLGVTLSLLGAPKGDAILQQALTTTKATGLESIFWNTKSLELGTFFIHDDRAAFEENVPLVEKAFKERTHPDATSWIEHLQALFSLRHGEFEKAIVQLETLLSTLENTPFFWIKLRTLKLYAQIRQSLGQETEEPRAQLEEMLQKIGSSLGNAPIQDEWQVFAENTRSLEQKSP